MGGQWSTREEEEEQKRAARTTSCLQAIPTPSHMALVQGQRQGVLKGLISQNCDGLHRRSGFEPEHLAELHGNTNLEYCGWCGKEYMRDFRASTGRHTRGVALKHELWKGNHSKLKLINPRKGNHYTGRRCQCPGCDGYLFDSTIDFGDNLPELHINRGFELAEQAGLCIVLGSRCSVSPACNMPISVGESGRDLVVVNLQKTAADGAAKLRIGAKIDEVMVPLMQMLNLEIPEFQLSRLVSVSRSDGEVRVRGVDTDETPNDLLWNVQCQYGCQTEGAKCMVEFNQDAAQSGRKNHRSPQPGDRGVLTAWPWEGEESRAAITLDKGGSWTVTPDIVNICDGPVEDPSTGSAVYNAGSRRGALLEHVAPDEWTDECSSVTLMFRSHYREPPVRLPPPANQSETLYRIVYSPLDGTWTQPEVISSSGPAAVEPVEGAQDAAPIYMNVSYQEQSNPSGEYRCFHQLQLEGQLLDSVAAVNYNTPGQGFAEEVHKKLAPPFKMKFGPCWGRPHVTVDLVMKDGTRLNEVWSENLPAADQKIALGVETA